MALHGRVHPPADQRQVSLGPPDMASALCLCYQLRWWDTNPVGHPNSLHVVCPAPGQGPATHTAAGHCCVPARSAPILASCY